MVFLISGFVISLTIIWRPIQNIQTLLERFGSSEVNLIPYSEFEDSETNRKNITTKQETIRPIGLALQTPLIEDEDHIIGFDGGYKFEKTSGDVLVSRYHNDNIFQDSKKICESFGLTAQHARYRGAQELNSLVENYECYDLLMHILS